MSLSMQSCLTDLFFKEKKKKNNTKNKNWKKKSAEINN